MPLSERCECGEPFVSNEDGWLTCARGHYERTPESRAEMAEASRPPRGAVDPSERSAQLYADLLWVLARADMTDLPRGELPRLYEIRRRVLADTPPTEGAVDRESFIAGFMGALDFCGEREGVNFGDRSDAEEAWAKVEVEPQPTRGPYDG